MDTVFKKKIGFRLKARQTKNFMISLFEKTRLSNRMFIDVLNLKEKNTVFTFINRFYFFEIIVFKKKRKFLLKK